MHHLILFISIFTKPSLNGKNFNNDDDIKSYLIQFFANKNQKFYERGIMKELSILNSYHPTERSILTKLNNAIEEKWLKLTNRKGVVFHHDNARPHASLVTRQKLLELGWNVLPHPPYSPDLAPSDYFLFRSLQNSLNGKNFNNDDDIKSYLIQFFANKNQKFYERGIMMLPERWQKIIDQNGQHIIKLYNIIKLFSSMKKLSLIF